MLTDGVGLTQVHNWFTNMRKRHWAPVWEGRREPCTEFERRMANELRPAARASDPKPNDAPAVMMIEPTHNRATSGPAQEVWTTRSTELDASLAASTADLATGERSEGDANAAPAAPGAGVPLDSARVGEGGGERDAGTTASSNSNKRKHEAMG